MLEGAFNLSTLSIVVAELSGPPIGTRAVWLKCAQTGCRSRILSALASAKRLFVAERRVLEDHVTRGSLNPTLLLRRKLAPERVSTLDVAQISITIAESGQSRDNWFRFRFLKIVENSQRFLCQLKTSFSR